MTNNDLIHVQPTASRVDNGRWRPAEGDETNAFLASVVPEESRESVRRSAMSILSRGMDPTSGGNSTTTGLVVGYIQSGKTMSFEALTALARDNGFQMVIVIAGVSNPLLQQSAARLCGDLGIGHPSRPRRWVHFENPSDDRPTVMAMQNVLDDWRDPLTPPEYRTSVLVTVLKQHQRLQYLGSVLSALNMADVPVLIIDDEADQASLNTKAAKGGESTTYRRLMDLRKVLPRHSFVQYTATPQAPLLISIIDSLSPSYVSVLEAGSEYVGGREFFSESGRNLVRVIPDEEVPGKDEGTYEPPDSLLLALRVFMVGVAAGILTSGNRGNRSMLVHPSHLVAKHEEYAIWVRSIFEDWQSRLRLPVDDSDRRELLEDLERSHADLLGTVGELPTFHELEQSLPIAFRNTRVLEVNTRLDGTTPEVEWAGTYGWILIGGQAMDRGFTVEGLTVTYMPRGIGVGNADTIQQRARFLGYKRRYLGFCRVYLQEATIHAFRNYVEHEEYMRGQLLGLENDGMSLVEWKRAFLLDAGLKPCRRNVLEFGYARQSGGASWTSPRVVLAPDDVIRANRVTIEAFLANRELVADSGSGARTDAQRHDVIKSTLLREVFEELLVPLKVTGDRDAQDNLGMLLQLRRALDENDSETCRVYRISPGTKRTRSVMGNGEIRNLFQGAFPVDPPEERGTVYPGDRWIRDEDRVTVQIHLVDLTQDEEVVAERVPVVAVWIPKRLGGSWIIQPQPGQEQGVDAD